MQSGLNGRREARNDNAERIVDMTKVRINHWHARLLWFGLNAARQRDRHAYVIGTLDHKVGGEPGPAHFSAEYRAK